ncbi:hypothetical protein V1477_011210 [Vespula maculifrons]|uniref:Uncharacterized protein n=1 Tax=Vespula maculifrons TaxID=7453 RepID=A0ABD2C454_VESMC
MNEQAKARWVSLYSKAKLLCPKRAEEKEEEEKKGEEVEGWFCHQSTTGKVGRVLDRGWFIADRVSRCTLLFQENPHVLKTRDEISSMTEDNINYNGLSSGVAARRDVEGNRRRKPLQEASAGSGLRKDSVNKSPVIRKNVPTVRNCRWAGGDRPVHFLRYASVKIF